jgi:hypothetical protein
LDFLIARDLPLQGGELLPQGIRFGGFGAEFFDFAPDGFERGQRDVFPALNFDGFLFVGIRGRFGGRRFCGGSDHRHNGRTLGDGGVVFDVEEGFVRHELVHNLVKILVTSGVVVNLLREHLGALVNLGMFVVGAGNQPCHAGEEQVIRKTVVFGVVEGGHHSSTARMSASAIIRYGGPSSKVTSRPAVHGKITVSPTLTSGSRATSASIKEAAFPRSSRMSSAG